MVKSIAEDLRRTFDQGNTLTRIIFVNIGIFVLINLVVDLLYFIVDPRLRLDSLGRGAH